MQKAEIVSKLTIWPSGRGTGGEEASAHALKVSLADLALSVGSTD